jgi:putative heme-binding domain-containing protein
MRLYLSCLILLAASLSAAAQDHNHVDQSDPAPKIAPPKVFLDKSPRIVEYQLKRLDIQRLLLVERRTDDKKYIPVYTAILSRVGVSPQFREEALAALVKLTESDPVPILLDALGKFDVENRDQRRTARQLVGMLLRQPREVLRSQTEAISAAIESGERFSQSVGFAALIVSGQADEAIARTGGGDAAKVAFLSAVELVPDAGLRAELRDEVAGMLESTEPASVQGAAISALGFIRDRQADSFERIAPFVSDKKLRDVAVRSLLKVPAKDRGAETSIALVDTLVKHAETTPAAKRTSAAFVDAMQLADQLMGRVPSDAARKYRQRLDAVTVRVIRIRTVEEEMRYDVPFFAVQAGKSVQIVLENHDLMPHNLVVTVPGALKEVAQLGLETGPNNGWQGLQYVPKSDKVLFATQMVPSDKQERLTFTAPSEPGEYPYVCTFPQHWYRMYGVMVVVEDLDDWLQNPVEPANPIGSNRKFVQAWKVDELKDELDNGMRGRTPEIGKRIFAEASCAGCHKVDGEGGIIGPELNGLFTRWKGDRVGVLREVLDPSHKVDAKYAMQRILTLDGQTITGVLIKEDDDNVTVMTNPEAKEPTVIPQDDIDAMVPSSVSMMPKALMDQYTKDELFELMAYLENAKAE